MTVSTLGDPIKMVFAGIHRRAENVRPHAHPCPELILINQGDCDVHVKDQALHAGPNDLITMPARMTHDQESNGYIDTLYLGFTEPGTLDWHLPRVLPLGECSFLRRSMQLLADIDLKQISAGRDAADALVGAVLHQLSHLLIAHEQTPHLPANLRAATRYLEDNLTKSITIDGMADHLQMSASNLHTLFRKHLDTSPMRYLLAQRMHAARSYLLNPYMTVKEVAGLCGYDDVNHFVRAFRQVTGLPPGRWRQQRQEQEVPRLSTSMF
ncbi:MAG: helix-turn-helix transcriptional regulator [Phycisphaeraceae bacterium]|nr:helix-turn-helix transcriptional regulator [Phycisphaeraceae bacterium]